MAELTSLKKQRSAAKQKFTRYLNLLSQLIKEDADILEINVLFDDISGAWRVVELRNDEYINMVPDDSTENCDEWIAPTEKNYINIRKEVLLIKRRTERKDLCESSKRVYLVKDCNFIAHYKTIESLIRSSCIPDTLANEKILLAANFEDLKRSHGGYVALATDADSKELLEILSNLSDTFNHVNTSIDRYTTSYKEKTAKRNTPFRMEKMLLPKFDANSRHYPRFLKDFMELVLPNIDTRESAYTLRQCLSKEVNDKLGSCDDDCDNMLKWLDVKYGDPSKIMESIVSDVQKF